MSDHPTNARDIDPAKLYGALVARAEEAKARRRAEGRAGFTDLDEAGKRAYKARHQAERRRRIREREEESGCAVFSTPNAHKAIIDAVMLMAAMGDPAADEALRLASRAFATPSAAEANMRSMAKRHAAKVLTSHRLSRRS